MNAVKERIAVSAIIFRSRLQEVNINLRNLLVEEAITTSIVNVNEIENCEIPKLTITNCALGNNLTIQNCRIKELELIDFTGKTVTIDGGHYQRIILKTAQAAFNEIIDLSISNIQSPVDVQIDYTTVKQTLNINGCHQLPNINSRRLTTNELRLIGNIAGKFSFRSLEVEETAYIAGQYETLRFSHCTLRKTTELLYATIKKAFAFNHGFLEKLHVSNESSIHNLRLRECQLSELYVSDTKVHHLNAFRLKDLELLMIRGFKKKILTSIEYFRFHGGIQMDKQTNFSVFGAQFGTFRLSNHFNKHKFAISNTEVTERFAIDHSDLMAATESTAEFSNLNLLNCKRISFYHTTILGSKFFNVNWNSDYRLDEIPAKIKHTTQQDKLEHYWSIKESYRQLKIASTENSNKIDTNFFQVGELDIYYKLLVLQAKSSRQNLIKVSGDLAILSISKFLGGYGLNIWRPILSWCVFHLIFFNILLLKIDFNVQASLQRFDPEATKKGIKLFVLLLSPVHGTEYFGVDFTGSITDLVIRIGSGFFLYYIIRASRKFIFN